MLDSVCAPAASLTWGPGTSWHLRDPFPGVLAEITFLKERVWKQLV